jgi:hypothetical protein
LCCGGCVSLQCSSGKREWNSLSSRVFQSTKWKSVKNLATVDIAADAKSTWYTVRREVAASSL